MNARSIYENQIETLSRVLKQRIDSRNMHFFYCSPFLGLLKDDKGRNPSLFQYFLIIDFLKFQFVLGFFVGQEFKEPF
jgi:hypothetical protein